MNNLATHEAPSWRKMRNWKYSTFDGFGEAYLCLFKRFLLLKYLQTLSFSFYRKYAWEKCWKNYFEPIFLGAHTVEKLPKLSEWNTAEYVNRHMEIVLQIYKIYTYKLIGVKMIKDKNVCMYECMYVYNSSQRVFSPPFQMILPSQ